MYNNDLLLRNYNTSCKYLMNIFQLNIIFIQKDIFRPDSVKKSSLLPKCLKPLPVYVFLSLCCFHVPFMTSFNIKLLYISLIRWTKVTKCVFCQWKTGSVTSVTQFLDCTKHMEFCHIYSSIHHFVLKATEKSLLSLICSSKMSRMLQKLLFMQQL